MTETLFPTIDIEGFTMIGAKITDTRTVLYLYAPTGRVKDGEDCEFDLSDGIVIGVKHPDDVDPGKPLAIPLGRAEGKYYFLSEKTLQVVDSNEISAAVQQTFFSMLVPDSLNDHDTLLDLAVRVRDSMELVKYKKPVEKPKEDTLPDFNIPGLKPLPQEQKPFNSQGQSGKKNSNNGKENFRDRQRNNQNRGKGRGPQGQNPKDNAQQGKPRNPSHRYRPHRGYHAKGNGNSGK